MKERVTIENYLIRSPYSVHYKFRGALLQSPRHKHHLF